MGILYPESATTEPLFRDEFSDPHSINTVCSSIDEACVALYRFTRFITLDSFCFLNRFGFAWLSPLACHLSVGIHIPECTSRHYTLNTAMTLCGVSCNFALVRCRSFASLAVNGAVRKQHVLWCSLWWFNMFCFIHNEAQEWINRVL